MSNLGLVEVRSRMISIGSKVVEKVTLDIPLEIIVGSNLEKAHLADTYRGQFQEAACHYYTVYIVDEEFDTKAHALIGLSQNLINLGRFRQSRRFLKEGRRLVVTLPKHRGREFLAQISSQYGWSRDYQGNFKGSHDSFLESERLLLSIPKEYRGEIWNEQHSTNKHFLGRAHFGLAYQGYERSLNLEQAKNYFLHALILDQSREGKIDFSPGKVGFGYLWLVRCFSLEADRAKVRELLDLAAESFRAQMKITPGRGVIAHIFNAEALVDIVDAELLLERSLVKLESAKRIREQNEPYPKGLADTLQAMASAYWRQDHLLKAVEMATKAIYVYPQAVIKPIPGA